MSGGQGRVRQELTGAAPADWPACPCCSMPRNTACPACGEAGSHFAPGDGPPGARGSHKAADPAGPAASDDEELFLCPLCDTAFPREYYRHCAWCGHDFGDGFAAPCETIEPISEKMIAAAVGIAGLLTLIGAYFAWLD